MLLIKKIKNKIAQIENKKKTESHYSLLLIFLAFSLLRQDWNLVKLALIYLTLFIIFPRAMDFVAFTWILFTGLLTRILTMTILFIVYFFLLTPIGLLRRLMGADSLILKKWKKDTSSVFVTRNHTYKASDLERPF